MPRRYSQRSNTKEAECTKCGEAFHSEARCPYVLYYEDMSVYNGDEIPRLKEQIKALVNQLLAKDNEIKKSASIEVQKRRSRRNIRTPKKWHALSVEKPAIWNRVPTPSASKMCIYNGDEISRLKNQIKALVDQLNLKDLELMKAGKLLIEEKKCNKKKYSYWPKSSMYTGLSEYERRLEQEYSEKISRDAFSKCRI